MANLQRLRRQHNSNVLTDEKKPTWSHNCRHKDNRLLIPKCLAKCSAYQPEVITTDKCMLYNGTSYGELKTKFNSHMRSFGQKIYSTDTELSKYILKLNNGNSQYSIK